MSDHAGAPASANCKRAKRTEVRDHPDHGLPRRHLTKAPKVAIPAGVVRVRDQLRSWVRMRSFHVDAPGPDSRTVCGRVLAAISSFAGADRIFIWDG